MYYSHLLFTSRLLVLVTSRMGVPEIPILDFYNKFLINIILYCLCNLFLCFTDTLLSSLLLIKNHCWSFQKCLDYYNIDLYLKTSVKKMYVLNSSHETHNLLYTDFQCHPHLRQYDFISKDDGPCYRLLFLILYQFILDSCWNLQPDCKVFK